MLQNNFQEGRFKVWTVIYCRLAKKILSISFIDFLNISLQNLLLKRAHLNPEDKLVLHTIILHDRVKLKTV